MLDNNARAECERKWIVPAPPDLNTAARRYAIEDRCLADTRLRLRTMTELAAGAVRVYELGQKVRRDLRDPMTVMRGTMYLDAAEFELLRALPAAEVVKVRHVFQVGNREPRRSGCRRRNQGSARRFLLRAAEPFLSTSTLQRHPHGPTHWPDAFWHPTGPTCVGRGRDAIGAGSQGWGAGLTRRISVGGG